MKEKKIDKNIFMLGAIVDEKFDIEHTLIEFS